MPIYGAVAEGLELLDVGKIDTLKQAEEQFSRTWKQNTTDTKH
jgi:hypothetical protein